MDIDTIKQMLQKDLHLNDAELDTESLRIPQLHSKYLNILHDEKLILQSLKVKKRNVLREKWEYYTGKLSEDQLKELGWEPFDLKILRQDVDIYLESDKELIELKNKMSIQEEKVEYLNSIVKGITNRQFHIRDAIAWRKFLNGTA